MSCQYLGKCSDVNVKCNTCMHGDRSYYVEYHEYPADKWHLDSEPRYGPPVKYPSPTSIEWPYLPFGDQRFQTGDDLRHPLTSDDLTAATGITSDGLEVWD